MKQDNSVEHLKGFIKYLYSAMEKKPKLKTKICHSITTVYQKYLLANKEMLPSSQDLRFLKMMKNEAKQYAYGFTYNRLLTSAVVVLDKLTMANVPQRKTTETEEELRKIYERLSDFSKYVSNVQSKMSTKKLAQTKLSYEDMYRYYLGKRGIEQNKILDKSVIQSIKSASNGSWVKDKNLTVDEILTDTMIASSNALTKYGEIKLLNDMQYGA